MKKLNKLTMIGAMAFAIGVTSITGFASTTKPTPAAVSVERSAEFREQRIEEKKENLKTQVKEGRITQERANEIIKAIEENQANCDGTGSKGIGQREGAGFGERKGQGKGKGQGQGGMRLRDGTCNKENK